MADLLSTIHSIITNDLFQRTVRAIILAIATIVASRVTTKVVSRALHQDRNPLPSSSIIINIARGSVLIIGGSAILDSCFDINTTSIVTALGVGGIAVSLGFQDTLSNLIGGLQVTFIGIVAPGDNIEVGGKSGIVQDVTWRHTTIKDSSGQTVIIPNSTISTTALVHLLPANRVSVPFTVPRHLTPVEADNASHEGADASTSIDDLADEIVEEARCAASAVSPVVDGPRVLFSEISELGIKGKVTLAIEDASKTARAADAVVRAVAQRLG